MAGERVNASERKGKPSRRRQRTFNAIHMRTTGREIARPSKTTQGDDLKGAVARLRQMQEPRKLLKKGDGERTRDSKNVTRRRAPEAGASQRNLEPKERKKNRGTNDCRGSSKLEEVYLDHGQAKRIPEVQGHHELLKLKKVARRSGSA